MLRTSPSSGKFLTPFWLYFWFNCHLYSRLSNLNGHSTFVLSSYPLRPLYSKYAVIFSCGLQIQVRSTSAIALLLALLYTEDFLFAKEECKVELGLFGSSRLSFPRAFDELENYFIGELDLFVCLPFSSPNSRFIWSRAYS